jgi:trehalose 6-phosphate synthase/phosphatase
LVSLLLLNINFSFVNAGKYNFQSAIFMDRTEQAELIEKYRKANNKLVLLDYDGTLVNYELIPDNARLPEHLNDILIKLIDKPQTKIFIISGRSHQDIDKLLDHLPINIIAEHGAIMKEGGEWKNQIIDDDSWKKTIIPILNQITSACPKSYVEEKMFTLTWHYRNADSQRGYAHSRELIRILEKTIHLYNLKILDGNKVVDILAGEIGKGKAVKNLSDENDYDFILSVGDDATDEEMFEFFRTKSNAFTIKVGSGSTCAKYNLAGIREVVKLLKQLSG